MPLKIESLEDLAQVLVSHRKKSGLTQAQLAKLAGLGKTVVFDIENSVKQPRLSTVLALFKVLNVTMQIVSPISKKSPVNQ